MQTITTIGLDIAKSVFQVHGVDAAGRVVIRRQLKRRHVRFTSESGHHANRQSCPLSARSGLVHRNKHCCPAVPHDAAACRAFGLAMQRQRAIYARTSLASFWKSKKGQCSIEFQAERPPVPRRTV